MIRFFAFSACLAAMAAAQPAPATVTLTYMGHATFIAETSAGLKILLDPGIMGSVKPAPVEGVDLVTVTHEHPDHNYVEMATGNPRIIRGLSSGEVAAIDETVTGVRIRTVASVHDSQQGTQRGKNAIFVFELPGLKLVHLGDLGCGLDAEQVSAIGPVDVLLVPVGGGPTIGPKTAVETAAQLSAKVVIPMHFGTAPAAEGESGSAASGRQGSTARRFRLGSVDDFLKALDDSTEVVRAGHSIAFTAGKLPGQRTVMVMKQK